MGAFEGFVPVEHLSLVVTTAEDELDAVFDPEDLSLREALQATNSSPGADTITFAPALANAPILLTMGELSINDALTITGLGAEQTIVDAQGTSRVFAISSLAGDVTFAEMTITGGRIGSRTSGGGGIFSESTGLITITAMNISNNSAAFSGGGISTGVVMGHEVP